VHIGAKQDARRCDVGLLVVHWWRTMNSPFTYAWRRQTNASSSKLSDEAPPSPPPPVVTLITSSDTMTATCTSTSNTHQIDIEIEIDEGVAYWMVPTQPPCTPEGLRSRPSASALRHELDLPSHSRDRNSIKICHSSPFPVLPLFPSSFIALLFRDTLEDV
jgi:hypothetical protein